MCETVKGIYTPCNERKITPLHAKSDNMIFTKHHTPIDFIKQTEPTEASLLAVAMEIMFLMSDENVNTQLQDHLLQRSLNQFMHLSKIFLSRLL